MQAISYLRILLQSFFSLSIMSYKFCHQNIFKLKVISPVGEHNYLFLFNSLQ